MTACDLDTGLMLPLHVQNAQTKGQALQGLSLAVKDVFHVAGYPTIAGNPTWGETHPIATQTSTTVQACLDQGVTLVGKTLTDELAYSLNGVNHHFGTPRNHQAPQRLPGGSSSGSAVAVSSGLADIGLGTDTGGSIRVPASYNGLFGLRPSHGLITDPHMVPLAPSFDTIGWMARRLSVMQAVGQCLLPQDCLTPQDRPYRRLVLLQPQIKGERIWDRQIDALVQTLSTKMTVNQETLVMEDVFLSTASDAYRHLQGGEIWQQHGQWFQTHQPEMAEDIRQRFHWCRTITKEQVKAAQKQRHDIQRLLESWGDEHTVLLMPTTPGAAPLLHESASTMASYRDQLLGMTAIAGLTRRPQLTLPVMLSDKAPWGLSLLGHRGDDLRLMHTAKQYLSHWKRDELV